MEKPATCHPERTMTESMADDRGQISWTRTWTWLPAPGSWWPRPETWKWSPQQTIRFPVSLCSLNLPTAIRQPPSA